MQILHFQTISKEKILEKDIIFNSLPKGKQQDKTRLWTNQKIKKTIQTNFKYINSIKYDLKKKDL